MVSALPVTWLKKISALLAASIIYSQLAFSAFAQSTSSSTTEYSNLDEVIAGLSLKVVGVAFVVLLVTALISLSIKKPGNGLKRLLFSILLLATLGSTIFLAGSTIYINAVSSSGGPVHWHADFEIWNCGQEVLLKKPTGFSNKIGTATLHEHDDKRIHLEGVVVHENNASLGNFIEVIDGSISPTSLTLPTTAGVQTFTTGNMCPDGTMGEMQVFVYTTNPDNSYSQKKLTDPASYIMSGHSQVPAGDCIIMEFGAAKNRTNKLCRSYQVAKEIHKLGQEVMPQ